MPMVLEAWKPASTLPLTVSVITAICAALLSPNTLSEVIETPL